MDRFGVETLPKGSDIDGMKIEAFHGKVATRKGAPLHQTEALAAGAILYEANSYLDLQPDTQKRLCRCNIAQQFNTWVIQRARGHGIPKLISDNPAYDWQWISALFDEARIPNPFGYSARRIGDYYAGLIGNFERTQPWKCLRITKHDHNPVHDALGNAEAFYRLQHGERGPDSVTKAMKRRYY